jgi:hypothetical protein
VSKAVDRSFTAEASSNQPRFRENVDIVIAMPMACQAHSRLDLPILLRSNLGVFCFERLRTLVGRNIPIDDLAEELPFLAVEALHL